MQMSNTTTSSPTPPKLAQAKDGSEFLYNSFTQRYIGKAVDYFHKYLEKNNEESKGGGCFRPYYAKFCSIVQSSGTGKSRLMIELRNKGVIVLYMNLRETGDDTSFPKRDPVPSRILVDHTTDCTRAEYIAHCSAFFTAIFQTLQHSELLSLHSGNPDAAIRAWNDKMCDMRSEARTEFFERVNFHYQAILDQIKIPKGSAADEAEVPRESFLTDAYRVMVTAMLPIFKRKGKGKEGGSDDEPKLVIAIDEAHPLSRLTSKGFRPSDILARVINSYSRSSDAPVWVVFASTTSHVVRPPDPEAIHNSMRIAVTGTLLYPPYVDLGWDQFASPLGHTPANDVARFDHIVGFGRPLWKSHVQQGSTNGVMEVAAQKLCNSPLFDLRDANQALAVLSQRFCLDIRFGHYDTVSYIERAVFSHLRVRFSATPTPTTKDTGYPSEPFLSCVAAILLHRTHDSLLQALLVLREKVNSGMIEIGASGELTSRLLLLLAKDLFICENPSKDAIRGLLHDTSGDAELLDCQKVSVIKFLTYLFGENFWSKAGEEAEEAFRHAYINFSHWVPMEELISSTEDEEPRCDAQEWTLRHWTRTSAVQCCRLQPLVDKMIPIYFDDPTLGSEDMGRVSQIFISDNGEKRRHELSDTTRSHDTIQCLSNLPYIALLLDLDVDLDAELDVTFQQKGPHHPKADRCLRIYASGMSVDTFPFLYKCPDILGQLQEISSPQKEDPSIMTLRGLVNFGGTPMPHNMEWEAQ